MIKLPLVDRSKFMIERQFERGLTPVSLSGHVVIVGWTNRPRA